ncbi:MAG: DUF29 domain-containing protein [Leptolyngbya sp. SIO4C1]|nr:DUF29 domain-containing protein [Leptolyngbya sp. SIO4C1]
MQSPELKSAIKQNLYKTDFYAWTQQQAALLRQQQWNDIDVANLVEEIEDLGKQQRQELRKRLSILLAHLLKWKYQPEQRSRSWLGTIRVQRREVSKLLQDSPSLKPYIEEAIASAYENARDLAMGETELPVKTFPANCPYSWADVIRKQFYPGDPSDLLSNMDEQI